MATNRSDVVVRVSGRDDLSPQLDKIESRLIRFVGFIGAGIAGIKIASAPIIAAVNFERELANVQKTTNFTTGQIKLLNKELLEMSTRVDVSAIDLAKIAAAAGQQGLNKDGVDGIVAFTASVSRMASVLDITAETAANDIGKIANIFKIPLLEIERAVSTFNEVSNNSTANGEELLDVVKRIGDAAGNLDLQQSVALAATGLDFGQSPEVVGTAFAKVFTSLTQKATEFGDLLGVSATSWIDDLQSNGLEAFKKVLASLRTLSAQSQQNTIVKLFGGGRIGALVNKLVQDTTDSVLNRNFENASKGALGLSAIKEQTTVLNTFKAQGILALNSLIKLGIQASDQLLVPLTKYLVELQTALNSDGARSFFTAVAEGVGSATVLFINFAKSIASLNINWENFLPYIKAFLGYKLFSTLVGIINRIVGFSSAMKSVANSTDLSTRALAKNAAAAAAADAAAAARAARSRGEKAAELLGYKAVYDAIQRNRAAVLEGQAAQEAVAKRQAALAVATAAAQKAREVTRRSVGGFANAAQAAAAQKVSLNSAVAAAAATEARLIADKQARILAAETAYQARRTAIETQFEARRAAIAASGSRAGLAAAIRDRDTALAKEEATQARSLRSIEAYWAKRLAVTVAGAKSVVAAESAAYAAALARVDTAKTANKAIVGKQDSAVAGQVAAAGALLAAQKAAAQVAALNPVLASQATLLGRMSAAWATLRLSLLTVGTVIGTVGSALVGLAGKLVPGLLILSLIYSIADSLGVIEKLQPILRSFTDLIGFTSAADRQAAVALEARNRLMEEEAQRVTELTKKYRDLAEAKSGKEFEAALTPVLTQISTSDSQEKRTDALKELEQVAAGNIAEVKRQTDFVRNAIGDQLALVEADTQKALARIAELQAARTADLTKLAPNTPQYTAEQEKYDAQIKAAVVTYATLAARLNELQNSVPEVASALNVAQENLNSTAKAAATLFTPKSVEFLNTYVLGLSNIAAESRRLAAEYEALQKSKLGLDAAAVAEKEGQSKELERRQAALDAAAQNLRNALAAAITEASKAPGVTKEVVQSLKDLAEFSKLTPEQLATFLQLISKVQAIDLTGKNVGVNSAGPTQGDGEFEANQRRAAALAERISKARVDLKRAENAAIANLEEEAIKQSQAATEEAFKNALISQKQYFTERQRTQVALVDAEITQRAQDIVDVSSEKPKDEADRIRAQAEVRRLSGQIAVLEQRKVGIRAETARDLAEAQKAFNTGVLQEAARLSDIGLIPGDTVEVFERTLEALKSSARVKLAELRANGQDALADSVEQSLSLDATNTALRSGTEAIDRTLERVNQVKTSAAQLLADGALTSFEAETKVTDSINAALPALEALIEEQERFLDGQKELAGTPGFLALQQQLAATRLQFSALRQETDATARSVNANFTSTLANSIATATISLNGLKDAFTGFLISISEQIKQVFATNIAERVAQGLGNVGGGGLGGFVSSLLGGGAAKPSGTPDNPIYTISATGAIEKVASNTAILPASISSLGDKIGGFFTGLAGSFSGGLTGVLSFLGTAFSSLISAVLVSSSASSTGSSLVGIATQLGTALVAHTGGVVGQTKLLERLVAPSMFSNATRYHTGGMAGLKPNEVPIIAEEGEEVITEDDPRHRNNLGKSGKGSSGGVGGTVNVWVVTPDQQPAVGPSDIIAVVSDNISRGGSIKQMIKQVQIGR